MTPSNIQKIRTAVALLRTHGENAAADGLLDVVEPGVLGIVKEAVTTGGVNSRRVASSVAMDREDESVPVLGGASHPLPGALCPHRYISTRSGIATDRAEVICAECGTVLGIVVAHGNVP